MAGTETVRKHRRSSIPLFILGLCAVLAGGVILGLHLNREPPAPVITNELLGQQLSAVQELVSVEYHYTNMGKFENQVDFYGWKVPFTVKSFLISYDGVILAGIRDLSQARITVNESAGTVTVTLPGSEIISHNIPEESIQVFDETHNIFNQITIEDYTGFTLAQKEVVARKALDNGLLTAADEKARAAVASFLSLVPGMDQYTLTVQ